MAKRTTTLTETGRNSGLVSVDGRTYPLKSVRVEAHAEGGIGFTALTQAYANPYKEPLEVIYTLPLPADGAVVGYEIRLGDRVIRGEVRKRSEAQEEYRKALLDGHTAALLEQERADTFTQKLGCLPAGIEAEVKIEVLQRLAFLPGGNGGAPQWEYRFPTVVGVRYEGAEGRVPDAEKLDVDRAANGIPALLEASLLVADSPAAALNPQAPGREIVVESAEGGVRIALKEAVRLDRDLVVRWSAAQEEVGIRVVEGRGLPCDDGRYILATVTPPARAGRGLARDLTLLIDASGSMQGKPLEHAKTVAEQLLHSLDPADRFEILSFAGSARRLVPAPTEATTENLGKAIAALRRITAAGSTEMAKAMVEALEPLRPGSQRQVILLSDGQIGFEGEVVGAVLKGLVPGARLHAVGIGSAPNRTLTRGVARAGRGIEIFVGDDDDAKAASRRLLQATVHPVITDIEVEGSALVRLAPRRPQDVFAGQPLVFLAEVSPAGGELEIRGKAAGSSWIRSLRIPRAGETRDGASLPATLLPLGTIFGREAIEDLELEIAASHGKTAAGELDLEIERLGLRHGIASRKTSLIAISEDPTVNPLDPRRRERLPVELPADVSAEGVGLVRAAALAPAAVVTDFLAESEYIANHMLSVGPFWKTALEPLRKPMMEAREPVRPVHVEIRRSRILLVDNQILVIEFEVPLRGLLLPSDQAQVHAHLDGHACNVSVIPEKSSAAGPNEKGLTVRLAIRLEDRPSWPPGQLVMRWDGEVQFEDGRIREGEVMLRVDIGAN